MNDKINLRSYDGKTVRVEVGPFSFSSEEAHTFADALRVMATTSGNLPSRHESHVDLQADCPLCVYEANGQWDRLTYDELTERAR